MGRNTECGHYVAHVKKEGQWVLFNDEKVCACVCACVCVCVIYTCTLNGTYVCIQVAESKNTPFQHGYMYLFARNDD